MEEKNPQDVNLEAQAPVEPKEQENQMDYKSFFDKQMEKTVASRQALEEKLSTKLSETQKLQIEREIFEIDKQLHELNWKPQTKDSVVDKIVESGIEVNTPAYSFLKEATKDLDLNEASIFIETMSEFAKLIGQKAPVDLNQRPNGDMGGKQVPVGFRTQDIIGDNKNIAKQNLASLIGILGTKE